MEEYGILFTFFLDIIFFKKKVNLFIFYISRRPGRGFKLSQMEMVCLAR